MNTPIYPANLKILNDAIDNRISNNDRPLIGISSNFKEGNSCIDNTYVHSILQAGGIPC